MTLKHGGGIVMVWGWFADLGWIIQSRKKINSPLKSTIFKNVNDLIIFFFIQKSLSRFFKSEIKGVKIYTTLLSQTCGHAVFPP